MTEVEDSTGPDGCEVCGAELVSARTGRPRRYCSPACRTRAWAIRRYSTGATSVVDEGGQAPAVDDPPGGRHVTTVPPGLRTAREWAALLDELSAELVAGPLGRQHYDHRHVYAALMRAYGALDHAHPGGIDELDRHTRRR